MNRLMILPAVAFALESFAGCSGLAEPWSAPISFRLSQPAAIREPVESRLKWREEAEELRTFADRHDVEADVLIQHQSRPDARLIQQRRALARQLRVAAAQMEQAAEEVNSGRLPRMIR